MGKLKAAYMAKTMDDMGPDEHPDIDFISIKTIPDEVYKEAGLANYSTKELLAEVQRRMSDIESSCNWMLSDLDRGY